MTTENPASPAPADQDPGNPRHLRSLVHEIVDKTPVVDMHTHLFAPQFGPKNLWGIDEILTYHYLIAEFFRFSPLTPGQFWQLSKPRQADAIWDELFVRRTPVSESAAGVVTLLHALGMDSRVPTLEPLRAAFSAQSAEQLLNRVLEIAGVSDVVMTNDPFDEEEASLWEAGIAHDPRFHAVVRLDGLLNQWEQAAPQLQRKGYRVEPGLSDACLGELRRFLNDWITRMRPVYLAVSLPDTFRFPEDSPRGRMLAGVVLPACQEHRLPLSLMIGVRRGVNPAIRDAGDCVGYADIRALEYLCREYPENRYLVSMLSRENQHELCAAARNFGNLLPFGCWWFLNNPSIVAEITRERLEMLGTSFIPQHSDARVVEHLIYKWGHSRRVVADALTDSYLQLARAGRLVTRDEIERDVQQLFRGNFRRWAPMERERSMLQPA